MNSYAQIADMQARFPMRDLIQLTQEDPTQVSINTTYLQTFLDDSANEIDTYLETRFALPLTDIPRVLTRICCEIAMYHLQALRPIHDLKFSQEIYNNNIGQLNLVREGKLTLGMTVLNLEPAIPTNPTVVEVHAGGDATGQLPMRVFSRGSLIGF